MFSKVNRGRGMNSEGVGIGLIICKRIIENSGGKIAVISEGEGKGSTFMFSMEMNLPDTEPARFNGLPMPSILNGRTPIVAAK